MSKIKDKKVSNRVSQLFSPLQYENKRLTIQASIVFYVNLAALIFCLLTGVYSTARQSTTWAEYLFLACLMLGLSINFVLLYQMRLKIALWSTALVIYIPTLLVIAFNKGFDDVILQLVYPLFIYIGLFLRKKGVLVFGTMTLVWIVLIVIFNQSGYYAGQVSQVTFRDEVIFSIIMLISTTFVMNFLINNTVIANDKLDQSAEVARIANAQKSLFLANMSHELRTPLNAIIGYSEGILEEHEAHGHLDHMTFEDVNRIRVSGRHLLGVINDILDLSKIEAEQMTLHQAWVDVELMIAHVMDTIRPLAEQKGNKLIFDNRLTPATKFVVDQKKTSQVLINLLSNGAKFTENGEVRLIVLNHLQEATLTFVVEDTGIGIPEASLSTIFDAFKQIDGAYNRKTDGTGLGLAISKRFVELMGGEIGVSSREGHGTQFTISLPARQAQSRNMFLNQSSSIG